MASDSIKRFLPVEKYQIHTKLSVEEVKERVSSLLFSDYSGSLNGNVFKMNRSIKYQNSFLPDIKGTITVYAGKTEIDVSMTMNLFVRIFMIVYLSLLSIPSLIILLALVRRLLHFYFKGLSPFIIIPIGMLIVGYLLMMVAFKLEARKSKKDLNKIFRAEPVPFI